MQTIKQIKQKMEAAGKKFSTPWLQLGIKLSGGGVKPTGIHRVKLLVEPTIEKFTHPVTKQEYQGLLFRLEENGVEKKWKFPL